MVGLTGLMKNITSKNGRLFNNRGLTVMEKQTTYKARNDLKRIDLTDEDIDMMLEVLQHGFKYLKDTMKVCAEAHISHGECPRKIEHICRMISALEYLKEH